MAPYLRRAAIISIAKPQLLFHMIMKRKLVSGAGKSCGAGPSVLASPPLLHLTRLCACFAGK
eukprot:4113836-Pyramimonas_sp.AAC.1